MRKFSILLATMIVAAMLVTACATEEPNTTPGAGLATATLEATETPDTGSGTGTPAAGAGTTTPGVPVTGGEDDPSRLSNLLDYGVWNTNGEQVGDVDDMVLDLDNTRISYVIVGVGGFLGLGEKEVLVPWNSLRLGAVDAAGGQQNGFIYEGDSANFENAPDWDANDLIPDIGEPAGDWDAEVRNFWETGALPPTPDPNVTATVQVEVTATPATGQGQAVGQAEDLQGVMLASDVLGATIILNQGQGQNLDEVPAVTTTGTPAAPGVTTTSTPDANAGQGDPGRDQINATIDDLIVDPETGEILYIVLDALFDDGERWIPVPLGFLQWDAANEAFVVKTNLTAIQNAPFFQGDQFPDTTVEGWNDEFDTFWANPDAGVQVTPTP